MSEEKYRPVKGDRVRVVLEGEVVEALSSTTFTVGEAGTWENLINQEREHVVSVEKIEPPVEVFGPGDTVRSRFYPNLVYSIGDDGCYAHHAREWRPAGEDDSYFTSATHERVELPK